MLMYFSEDQRCTIQQTVLSNMFLNEVDVLLQELGALPTTNEISLVACYNNGYTKIVLKNPLRKR
jgi:hypothetical protein